MLKRRILVPAWLFVAFFVMYFISSEGRTPYDYFVRQAGAFLEGRIFLNETAPWLSEMIELSEAKYTFVNPFFPAVLLVPFVAVFGDEFSQQLMAHLLGAGAVVASYELGFFITRSRVKGAWMAVALGAGSIVWFLASVGSVWYLGQVSALFFLLWAMAFLYRKRSVEWLALGMFTFAALSRTQLFAVFPLFVLLATKKRRREVSAGKIMFYGGVAMGLALLVAGFYNWARFGSELETGYVHIPRILSEPWFTEGIFSYKYIPRHLRTLLFGMPEFRREFPFVLPTLWGLSIAITSPVFAFLFQAPLRDVATRISLASTLIIATVNFSFGSTGFSQFGYRYAVDFYGFVVLLLALSLKNRKLTKLHWIALVLSVLVNAWGVVFINKLGWVG